MFRSALVALKPDLRDEVVVQCAVDLANRHGWHLAGISVLDRDRVIPPEAVPLGGAAYKTNRDETLLTRRREQIAECLASFQHTCDSARISAETICTEDDLYCGLASAVQRFDILLTGHTTETETGGNLDGTSPLAGILKHCPRPVIVVPALATNGSSIVVAYDGSVQAARALEAFVASGLECRAPIHVVSTHKELQVAKRMASVAVEYLQKHDRAATPHGELLRDAPADHILDCVARHSARMLVMGAYGKPTISEFLFGSVTRTILRTVALPVFLDH
ncbi:MAG: universal stress protein [Planctomycetales bacterium]|nr:universal stress protein [Planctomycetales bacterium]